ncbi:MAG: GNAT family N-acetyltransferase [Sulfuricurvum sp.]|uniref:GNAT family N-acetyltransferase n=1 Tax=Sulfuricurvum sp. TaxID=2025608 RepID=UPI002638931B|nr:GNAT family N-acetyltransferase [Sulfuricurvum sp.]MDD5159484.1 GNAT family N-acetyltransferase [Sulfuricurvum sp.]
MPLYHIESLGRDAYITSIAKFQDRESIRFADQSLAWWDRHFSWNAQGCAVLCNERNEHLCYLFSKIDRYGEYITLYNLFTPLNSQRNGYATHMLRLILDQALEKHVRRITFSSVSASLDFYQILGFIYWGVNDIGDYYCNLPLPKSGLAGIIEMVQESDIKTLIGSNLAKINAKIDGNERHLSPTQSLIHKADILKLGKSYVRGELKIFKELSQSPRIN